MPIKKMPPTEGRPLQRKMKHDASKTLDEWTKKQHNTLEFCNLDIVSTWSNTTLIGISLVLSHRPHFDVPKPLLTRRAKTTKRDITSPINVH
jgi:hypothetical protein